MTLLLTFDDGPSEWTPKILDLLAEHEVKATFFVVGSQIAGREGILRRAGYDRHAVGNHTWNHPRLTDPALTVNAVRRELRDTSARIAQVVGKTPPVWRAPYFGIDDRADVIGRDLGMTHIGADIVPDDWRLNDATIIAERVIEAARTAGDNPVVCLHDGIPPDGGSTHCTSSRQPTVDAVRIILEAIT